jgi:hypothetical protein
MKGVTLVWLNQRIKENLLRWIFLSSKFLVAEADHAWFLQGLREVWCAWWASWIVHTP